MSGLDSAPGLVERLREKASVGSHEMGTTVRVFNRDLVALLDVAEAAHRCAITFQEDEWDIPGRELDAALARLYRGAS